MGTAQPHLLPAPAHGRFLRHAVLLPPPARLDRRLRKPRRKNYDLFRSAISRLSTVSYRNDHFYDPIRGEHRDVGFGFLSYSLPLDPGSSRAWRFAWDPIFFEFCSALRGALLFDFRTYRRLDEASRRLYLLLRKIFWRNEASPTFELRDIAVHTIGFSATHETYELKRKLWSCIQRLAKEGVIRLPLGTTGVRDFCSKTGKGRYVVQFHRGPHFEGATPDVPALDPAESALYEPLATIGFEPAAIRRILAAYDPRLVAECADMTLAARERFGAQFFKKSPQAYFTDNIQKQSRRERTPPDWWRALRAEEERCRRESASEERPAGDRTEERFRQYLETEARETFEQVMSNVFRDFKAAGQSDPAAKQNARRLAGDPPPQPLLQGAPRVPGGRPNAAGRRPARLNIARAALPVPFRSSNRAFFFSAAALCLHIV